jgi:AbrB family looped-hinge helix DNA binding protein
VAERVRTARTKVDRGGRIVLPVEYRRSLGIETGDEVVLVLREGQVRVSTLEHAIKRAQEAVAPYLRNGPSLVDELIEERRRERNER